MDKISFAPIAVAALWLLTPQCATAQNWKEPVWSDEFNASVPGSPLDRTKWTFDVGSHGWGNHEIETYCGVDSSSPPPCDANHPNAYQDGRGNLVIQATRTNPERSATGTWTSARIKTLGRKDFQFGRLESCMVLPIGAGLWPAFWMLGTSGAWPLGGEMDIMENVPATGGAGGGLGPHVIESTIHGPSSSSKTGIFSLAAHFTFPAGGRVDDKDPRCHVYGTIWSPFMVQIYVDDWRKPFFIRTANQVPPGGRWVFNAPFYFILNMAVGGDWPGPPNASTPSPAQMLIDYVRVYRADRVSAPKMSADPVSFGSGHSGSTILHLAGEAGSGYLYLTCSTGSEKASCSINTNNPLNASVVDFRSAVDQAAEITITSTGDQDPGSLIHTVSVSEFTVSGDQSTLSIPVKAH